MTRYVARTDIQFDQILVKEVSTLIDSNSDHVHSGINLIRADGKPEQFGCGSLYDYHNKQWIAKESDFNTPVDAIRGLYIEHMINEIRQYAVTQYKTQIGRVRIMILRPKSCLTWHTDIDPVTRFHIPIVTNEGAMFIHQDPITEERIVSTMPQVCTLYTFNSMVKHTAINCSRQIRVHIVASTYY